MKFLSSFSESRHLSYSSFYSESQSFFSRESLSFKFLASSSVTRCESLSLKPLWYSRVSSIFSSESLVESIRQVIIYVSFVTNFLFHIWVLSFFKKLGLSIYVSLFCWCGYDFGGVLVITIHSLLLCVKQWLYSFIVFEDYLLFFSWWIKTNQE
jgi:hypothetical protein